MLSLWGEGHPGPWDGLVELPSIRWGSHLNRIDPLSAARHQYDTRGPSKVQTEPKFEKHELSSTHVLKKWPISQNPIDLAKK